MSNSPKNIVAFCGAGLSVGAGLPVMASFGEFLRTSRLLTNEELNDFDAIQANCTDMSALIGASARNLEHLASFLEILNLARPTYHFADSVFHMTPLDALGLVKKAISAVYFPSTNNYRHNSEPLLDLARNDNLSVITTNYDLNIELAAARRGMQTILSSDITERQTFDGTLGMASLYSGQLVTANAFCGKRVRLFKLHGSVNWYRDGSAVYVDDRINGVDLDVHNNYRSVQFVEGDEDWRKPENSLFVAPTVLKPGLFDAVRGQWIGAAEALGTAEVLVFIGYSFPESDTFMRFFLASALHRNVHLTRIVVIDPNAQHIVPRIRTLLEHPQHADIWQAVPVLWENVPVVDIAHGKWNPRPNERVMRGMRERLEVDAILRGELVSSTEIHRTPLRGRGR